MDAKKVSAEVIEVPKRQPDGVAQRASDPEVLVRLIKANRELWESFIANLMIVTVPTAAAIYALFVSKDIVSGDIHKVITMIAVIVSGVAFSWRVIPAFVALTIGTKDITALRHMLYGETVKVKLPAPEPEKKSEEPRGIKASNSRGTIMIPLDSDDPLDSPVTATPTKLVLGPPFDPLHGLTLENVIRFVYLAKEKGGFQRSKLVPRGVKFDIGSPLEECFLSRETYDAIIAGLSRITHPMTGEVGLITRKNSSSPWSLRSWNARDITKALSERLMETR